MKHSHFIQSHSAITYKPCIILAVFTFFLWFYRPSTVFCSDDPFDNGANWGGTGLMEIPTARVLKEGDIRFGYAQADPFRWYAGGMGIFSFLEVSGRYTEIRNIPSGLGSDYGAQKDKAFDLKLQIVPESKDLPAIAVGLHDFHGTKLFEAQYLAISRQIFPFDLTMGIGRGRLNGPPYFSLGEEIGLFGGIEFAVTRRFHLMAEYNPIRYEEDKAAARGVPEGADSPVNFGLRMKVLPGMNLGLSYQRGNTFGVALHLQAELGEPLLPKKPDPPLWRSVDRRSFSERNARDMTTRIYETLCDAGFQNVKVSTNGKDITACFENNKYLDDRKAAGRVLRILLFYSPSDTKMLNAVMMKRRMPVVRISAEPQFLEKYLFGEISDDHFLRHAKIEITSNDTDSETITKAPGKEFNYSLGIRPSLETYFNDPSGVLKLRAGVRPYFDAVPWKGACVSTQYDVPLYSDISSSNEPLPNAVRSDSWLYLDRDYYFDRLMLDQVFRLSNRAFGRISFGYLENMYAGIGGELLVFLGKGDIALGVEGDWVRKREPGTQFDLLDLKAYTVLADAYWRVPHTGITLQAQCGRFLAGDKGFKFYASREYSTGAQVGFWYSYTDSYKFTGFNKGYHDKGVFLTLPASMFLNHDSKMRYGYAMSPWTRDVAATVFHWSNLFGFGADLMPALFFEDIGKIKE